MQRSLSNGKLYSFLAFDTNKRILLFLILVMALGIRLYKIDQPYTDMAGWRQCSTAMMADNFHHRNSNILYPEVSWNGPAESYNGREFQTVTYITSLLYYVLGQYDWVGRLVAIFFGVWGVFAFYQLVRRIWGEKQAIASAAMLALLPGSIFFDRSFLPDPAMVSLVTTSLWFFMAYLQTNRNAYLILTMLTACLGFLTKITGMIVLLPMLYAIITSLVASKRFTASNIIKIVIPGLVVVAIVAAYYSWARYLSLHYPPYHFAGSGNWLWNDGLRAWLAESYFLYNLSYIFQNWMLGWPFILLFLVGLVVSLPSLNKQVPTGRAAQSAPFFFHFWLVGFVVYYIIGAKELIHNFWNFHILDPVIAAFCGYMIVFILEILRNRKIVAWTAGLLLFAVITVSNRRVLRNTFTDKYYKSDYHMGQQLNKLRNPGDLVVVLSQSIGNPLPIYYSKGRGWVFPPAGKEAWDRLPQTDSACITTLENLREQGADWFGINLKQYKMIESSYPQFTAYLNRHYSIRTESPEYKIFQLAQIPK